MLTRGFVKKKKFRNATCIFGLTPLSLWNDFMHDSIFIDLKSVFSAYFFVQLTSECSGILLFIYLLTSFLLIPSVLFLSYLFSFYLFHLLFLLSPPLFAFFRIVYVLLFHFIFFVHLLVITQFFVILMVGSAFTEYIFNSFPL